MVLKLHDVGASTRDRPRWEYRWMSMPPDPYDIVTVLNAAGEDGWELVDVSWLHRCYTLKRRL